MEFHAEKMAWPWRRDHAADREVAVVSHTRVTSQDLQHEAIEAQKAMVGSPNHTTIYTPVGPLEVPLVGTFDALRQGQPQK